MAKKPRPWSVTPHGPLERLEENLWALSSPVPGLPIFRRMSMVRLADGRIVFVDAVPMDEPTLAEIRAWGMPAILFVSNGYHRIDIRAFAERLGLRVFTPADSAARVSEVVRVDGGVDALPSDPALRPVPLVGVKGGEVAFLSKAPSGKISMLFSDGVMNMHEKIGLMPRLMGFSGGPKVAPMFKLLFVRDRKGLRAQYQKLAQTPDLARIVLCHGDTIERDAPGALRAAAATI